jgi:uncharacterized protein YqgC (DUF456 family)
MTNTILLWVIAMALIIAGFAGLVLPALPGAPLLFAGLFVAAWADDFVYVGVKTLVALGIMAALSYVLEFAASALGARRFGATRRAITGAAIGTVVGMFFGLPGILLGPFLGAVVGELTAQRDLRAAAGSGVGAFLGLLLAIAGKLALGFAMLGLFLLVRFL